LRVACRIGEVQNQNRTARQDEILETLVVGFASVGIPIGAIPRHYEEITFFRPDPPTLIEMNLETLSLKELGVGRQPLWPEIVGVRGRGIGIAADGEQNTHDDENAKGRRHKPLEFLHAANDLKALLTCM
jgi:hypothetical protein